MCTYINSVGIHWELLVKFSCDPHKILSIELTFVTLLVFVNSGCCNIKAVIFNVRVRISQGKMQLSR